MFVCQFAVKQRIHINFSSLAPASGVWWHCGIITMTLLAKWFNIISFLVTSLRNASYFTIFSLPLSYEIEWINKFECFRNASIDRDFRRWVKVLRFKFPFRIFVVSNNNNKYFIANANICSGFDILLKSCMAKYFITSNTMTLYKFPPKRAAPIPNENVKNPFAYSDEPIKSTAFNLEYFALSIIPKFQWYPAFLVDAIKAPIGANKMKSQNRMCNKSWQFSNMECHSQMMELKE